MWYPCPINRDALQFLSELGSWRLEETTGDVRASSFLFQRISVVVQRFNSVLLHDGFLDDDRQTRVHYQTHVVICFCNFWAIRGFPWLKQKCRLFSAFVLCGVFAVIVMMMANRLNVHIKVYQKCNKIIVNHRWPPRERLPLSATIHFNSVLQCSRCLGIFTNTTHEDEM